MSWEGIAESALPPTHNLVIKAGQGKEPSIPVVRVVCSFSQKPLLTRLCRDF